MYETYDVKDAFEKAYGHETWASSFDKDVEIPDSGVVTLGGRTVAFEVIHREGFDYDYESMGYGGLQAYVVVNIEDELYRFDGRIYSHIDGFEVESVFRVEAVPRVAYDYQRIV